MLVILIQHANPFYDDSYAVNSANVGPYGDAITYELIPYIEEKFRGLGEGWARFLYGGSTGGWEKFETVDLGSVELTEKGNYELVIQPKSKPGLGVMNLRSVELKPVE